MKCFVLNKPTMAIQLMRMAAESNSRRYQRARLIHLRVEPHDMGLVDVCFNGGLVTMFFQDIQERGERLLG
jgi:hypothetical protein